MTNNSTGDNEFLVAAAVNDFYDYGEPSGGDDLADRIVSFSEIMEIIRTHNIDGTIEFYNDLLASGYLTEQQKNYASRVMRANYFDVPLYQPSTAPPTPTGFYVQNASHVGEHPHLVWNASPGATSYVVERCYSSTSTCAGSYTQIGTPTSTSFDDNDTTINAGYTCSSVPRELTLYRVSAKNSYGTSAPTPNTNTCASENGSFAKTAPEFPGVFALHGNAPNPFSTSTEIRFDLPEAAHVTLAVYNMLGQEARELVSADMPAGFQHVTFNPEGLASGVYLYRITAGTFTETKRMVVAK